MTTETWAIVGATFLGPVFAVIVTFIRERTATQRNRRLNVFRTLMATRKMTISTEHVAALNIIEVEFYGCREVIAAWTSYIGFLDTKVTVEDFSWNDKRFNLLAKLLYEMSKELKFRLDTLEIFKGGYAPGGWKYREDRDGQTRDQLRELLNGDRPLRVRFDPPERR